MVRAAGWDRPLAQAMQTAGYVRALIARFFGDAWSWTGWQDTKFLRPVLAGERLDVGGSVLRRGSSAGKTRADVRVWVRDASGNLTAVGLASTLM